MKVEILEFDGEGYSAVLSSDSWRIGMINYTERLKEGNNLSKERHFQTDEAFILLCGDATLHVEGASYKLEPYKIYNVKKNEWHRITMSENAKVLVVENDNTGPDNTEKVQGDLL